MAQFNSCLTPDIIVCLGLGRRLRDTPSNHLEHLDDFSAFHFRYFPCDSTAVLGCVTAKAAQPIRCTVIIDEQSGDTLYR